MNWLTRIFKPHNTNPQMLVLENEIKLKERDIEHLKSEYELRLTHKSKELEHCYTKIKELEETIKSNHYDPHINIKHNITQQNDKPLEKKKLSKQERLVYSKYLEHKPEEYKRLQEVTNININNLRQIRKRIITKGHEMPFFEN